MREIQFRQAVAEAMSEEMRENDDIILIGEEVAEYNGAYKASKGMLEEFSSKRIIDTPISELGFAGFSGLSSCRELQEHWPSLSGVFFVSVSVFVLPCLAFVFVLPCLSACPSVCLSASLSVCPCRVSETPSCSPNYRSHQTVEVPSAAMQVFSLPILRLVTTV